MSKVRKAIIPVAGFGTRFLPATKAQPKEMLPLVDKPIIQYIVEEAVASGIEEIIFITSQNKRAIEDHFDRNFELEYRLRQKNKQKILEDLLRISDMAKFIYIRQKTPRGSGDAVLLAKELIGDEPFALFFGDDVIDSKVPAMKQLMDVYQKYQDIVIGVTKIDKKQTEKYGIVGGHMVGKNVMEIDKIVEKPKPSKAPSNWAVTGRYILTPDIFKLLEKTNSASDGEVYVTNAIATHIKKQTGFACAYNGDYYDCGSKLGFVKATVNFALKHPEFKTQLKSYLKKI